MKDFDGVMREVELIMRQQLHCQQELQEIGRSVFGAALEEEIQSELRQTMASNRERLIQLLQRTVDFPPRHLRHFGLLDDFWRDGSYSQSVFIMSKFPDASYRKDEELRRVLDVVAAATQDAGFVPRIARGPNRYHETLWDNVELHLLACRQGIAIVEDCYRDELNPNVTMEWGWMRGMGKSVLFLVEEGFTNSRADVGGLIQDTFTWDSPEANIAGTVGAWLRGLAGGS
jgi:hypothetical protein